VIVVPPLEITRTLATALREKPGSATMPSAQDRVVGPGAVDVADLARLVRERALRVDHRLRDPRRARGGDDERDVGR
jgi:hypothetical protein